MTDPTPLRTMTYEKFVQMCYDAHILGWSGSGKAEEISILLHSWRREHLDEEGLTIIESAVQVPIGDDDWQWIQENIGEVN